MLGNLRQLPLFLVYDVVVRDGSDGRLGRRVDGGGGDRGPEYSYDAAAPQRQQSQLWRHNLRGEQGG